MMRIREKRGSRVECREREGSNLRYFLDRSSNNVGEYICTHTYIGGGLHRRRLSG